MKGENITTWENREAESKEEHSDLLERAKGILKRVEMMILEPQPAAESKLTTPP